MSAIPGALRDLKADDLTATGVVTCYPAVVYRPHYASCPFVCLSVCSLRILNSKTEKHAWNMDRPKFCERF